MSLSSAEIVRILSSLGVLLTFAHLFGYLFRRIRQPRVIGEILGGLVLGPTLLGTLLPGVQDWLFPSTGATATVLATVYQFGLLLLMFLAGTEMRLSWRPAERRVVGIVTGTGTLLPLGAGFLVLLGFDPSGLAGPSSQPAALGLVFAIAIAVTSIPVISRIMHDLGILDTAFARIVLSVAVLEDLILYVLLAIALALVQRSEADVFGLPALLGVDPSSAAGIAYHVAAALLLFALLVAVGPVILRVGVRSRLNVLKRASPIASQLLLLFLVTGLALSLGVAPVFGAFAAGIVAATARGPRALQARSSIADFAFAFFIPLYFAIVGLQLDLIRRFDLVFFLLLLVFASVAKALSVYLGARLAGDDNRSARNLAVALNARGGPGIVLASVSFDAGIINEEFYSALVMLAIVTSLMAGAWLERLVRSGAELRGEAPTPAPERREARGDRLERGEDR
jgi:Kef-type K+ transport system membrane component KefB